MLRPRSATFRPDAAATIREAAEFAKSGNAARILVVGHTDTSGPEDYNMGLSERRAQSVAGYLAARGVRDVRLGTRGYGESQPVASNDTEAGRAANRRVEIKLVPIRRD